MPEFRNEPIELGDLPVLAGEDFRPVHGNYLRVALVGVGVAAGFVVAAGIGVAIVIPRRGWIPLVAMAAILLLLALVALAKVLEVRHIGYQVRQHDISYRSGVIVRTVSTVPFVRVQHARSRQGPIERRFGLATVEVNSAGPDLRIEGLAYDEAERLKNLVLERAGALAEDS